MKRTSAVLLMLMILLPSAFSTTRIDSAAFDITAFKDGAIPRTVIRVSTGVIDQNSYVYDNTTTSQAQVYDITAAAQLGGGSTVSNVLAVEVSTNERISVTIRLVLTPFKKYISLAEGTLDSTSTWKDAKYVFDNPTVANGGIGVVENCSVKGKSYNYYSKLTTKNSFSATDGFSRTVTKSNMNNTSDTDVVMTNMIIALDSNISLDSINNNTDTSIPSGSAQSLPGIGNNMLTSRRVLSLSNINLNSFDTETDYVSYVSVFISVN